MRRALRVREGAEQARRGEEVARVRTVEPVAGPQQALGNRWVQHLLRAGAREPGERASAEAAERGAAAGGSRLAHGGEIQRAFGRHDVSGLVAHVGGEASAAARSIGARGFASGRHLVFDEAPSLRVAAHEAAHAVQQRHLGGAPRGEARRACEEHAEVVAEAVAEGRAAEPLLDAFAAAPVREVAPGGALQRVTDEAQLPHVLKLPDGLSREAEVFEQLNAKEPARTLKKGNHIKIVEDGLIAVVDVVAVPRVRVQWYEWDAGWKVRSGYVDAASIARGGTQQTALAADNDDFKIKPATAAGISQADVYQNRLSDCYLQATLAALAAKSPQALFDAIDVALNEVRVQLYLQTGKLPDSMVAEPLVRTAIRLERSLFLDPKQQPVYGGKSGANHYLWPAFFGKAFAVVAGSYASVAMGQAGDAMRAITGAGDYRGIGGQLGVPALRLYREIRDGLAANEPVVLGTTNFAKSGLAAFWNGLTHASGQGSRPQGQVRGLHSYAVISMNPVDLADDAFANGAIPNVTVTLRDPRDATGATFTRKLKDIFEARKFTSVHVGSDMD